MQGCEQASGQKGKSERGERENRETELGIIPPKARWSPCGLVVWAMLNHLSMVMLPRRPCRYQSHAPTCFTPSPCSPHPSHVHAARATPMPDAQSTGRQQARTRPWGLLEHNWRGPRHLGPRPYGLRKWPPISSAAPFSKGRPYGLSNSRQYLLQPLLPFSKGRMIRTLGARRVQ